MTKRLLDMLAVAIVVSAFATVVGVLLSLPYGWVPFVVIGAAAAVCWALIRLQDRL